MAWVSPLDRVPLQDLRFRHRHDIAELRTSLEVDLDEAGHPEFADDVWLLRYVLSYKDDAAGATSAARQAIKWRQENASLVETARQRRPPPEFTEEELQAIELFFTAAYLGTTLHGDPLFVSRLGSCNLTALMDKVSEEKLELWLSFTNECVWQYCEAATRDRGIFVKQINIQDAANVSMAREQRFLNVLGRSSKTNEWLRPQLIGKTYIFNVPLWAKLAHKVARNFMSRRSIEKVWIHPTRVGTAVAAASPKGKDAAADEAGAEQLPCCPFAQQLLGGAEALPTFMGGLRNTDEVLPAKPRTADAMPAAASEGFESLPSSIVVAGGTGGGTSSSSTSFSSCSSRLFRRFAEPVLLAGLPRPPSRSLVPEVTEEAASLAERASTANGSHEGLAAGKQEPLSVDEPSDAIAEPLPAVSPGDSTSGWGAGCRRFWLCVCCRRKRRGEADGRSPLLLQSG